MVRGAPKKSGRESEVSSRTPTERMIIIAARSEKDEETPPATATKKKGRVYSAPQLLIRPRVPIPPGTAVKAKLISAATNGPVQARITENAVVHGETLVEAGSRVFGQGTSSDSRLMIQFRELVTNDGAIQTIKAEVIDPEDKFPGLKGSELTSRALKFAGSVGLNFLGGFSNGLQDTEVKKGIAVKASSIKNGLLNGAAQASLDESKEMMSSLKSTPPSYSIEEGREVLILFIGQ